jgi:hypothetical protein
MIYICALIKAATRIKPNLAAKRCCLVTRASDDLRGFNWIWLGLELACPKL